MPEIPDEIYAQLLLVASANGIDMGVAPEGSEIGNRKPIFPAVHLGRAVSEIAHETGLNLKNSGLYLYMGGLVTVDETGAPEEMDSDRFRTWIDQFQLNYLKRRQSEDGQGAPIKATMKADVAKVMLRSDEFLGHLPEIKRILPVRLPVLVNENDVRGMRILPYGYDAKTQVFTRNTGIEYLENWTLDNAVKYLRELLQDFPFGDVGRSLAVQIAAMLTTYCQLFYAPRDRIPMIYFNANQPGSGKTRLAEMVCYAIYGEAEPITYSDNDEFTKKLDTWAQDGSSYTFLDDVSGLVKNNDLNRWLTSPTWGGRIMHKQKRFSVLNQTITLLTGNQATLSDDLTRRSLMVDLWSSELPGARAKRITRTIDAEWLAAPLNRSDILSALHALVYHWAVDGEAKPYGEVIASFEGWARIVPAIVTLAGFECPLQPPNVQDAGGKQEVEFQRLLAVAVKDYEPQEGKPVDILLTDWCRLARFIGVFHSVVSDAATTREVLDTNSKLWKAVRDKDGNERALNESDRELQALMYMDKSQSTKFGNLLNKFYRGQVREINGRNYKFADREARHSTFSLELLPSAAAAA